MTSGLKDICFSPDSCAAISIGSDSDEIKLWEKSTDSCGKDKWLCSGSRKTLNLEECFKQVKYSPDGSLICLATRKRLVFVHGDSLEVVFVYTPSPKDDAIKMMNFFGDCHLCLILRSSIVCINLISMTGNIVYIQLL